MESINIKKLKAGTVYKIILLGSFIGFIPISLLIGVLAFFDMATVTWNGHPVTGVSAILVAPLVGAMISLLFTAIFGSITVLGLWLYSKFKPISVSYIPEVDKES